MEARGCGLASLEFAAAAAVCLALLGGCSRLRPKPTAQYVYVTAKQTFLRDRVAAVSNRTGTVENGEKLEVLEHGRRSIRVKTDKGEQGWIDEKAVATQEVFDAFQALARGAQGRSGGGIGGGAGRGEPAPEAGPGDGAVLPAGGGRQAATAGAGDAAQAGAAWSGRAGEVCSSRGGEARAKMAGRRGVGNAPAPIAMEDWWLARDAQGRTGWLLSRMLDVDAPDSVAKYAEGQRIVGAYVLTTVNDPGAEAGRKGTFPST